MGVICIKRCGGTFARFGHFLSGPLQQCRRRAPGAALAIPC